MNLRNKRVTVMGLGIHGGAIGAIKWLVESGAKVVVTDLKESKDLSESIAKIKMFKNVELVLGKHRLADFRTSDIVLRNPAVPRDSKFILEAREQGVAIEMDSSLFFKFCPSKYTIGVTGTKGKSTTTAIIGEILTKKMHASVVGLEGTSPLGELENLRSDSVVIFELSSWRLEGMAEHKLSPHVAVVTSLYRDHLNTYDSFSDYVEAKKAIISNQSEEDIAILNADDELIAQWSRDVKGKLFWYAVSKAIDGEGIFVLNKSIHLRLGERKETICSLKEIGNLKGHKLLNALPGMLLGAILGLNNSDIIDAVSQWHGLPHRLQSVSTVHGIEYINDSAATIPDATISALKILSGKKIVHILGGNDKELIYDEWAKVEDKANLSGLIWLPGDATAKMKNALAIFENNTHTVSFDAETMDEAVQIANKIASKGDIVLLSPGATSFGSFKHEFDRGDKFVVAVKALS